MRRIICDGCDKDVTSDTDPRIEVAICGTVYYYDLCERCSAKLSKDACPSNWPRVIESLRP